MSTVQDRLTASGKQMPVYQGAGQVFRICVRPSSPCNAFAGGYVPWWLDLEPASATRELFVLADNRCLVPFGFVR